MNIGASLSSAIAELGSQMAAPVATASATANSEAVSASSSLLMKVADETVAENNNSLGSVDAWA